ncbi:NUDIX domain-containing protein [Bacteriovorax sp. Seq25_V]|uniref:NUDIX domain-containing protein n=1 Tax=Bacteriovorax sp. Seq25_V TaxID=1201288 RepID=UPI00038A2A1D|nr:NUDIX domain-containing protein [Bacteriovorax sp. Seq25_V]EQC43958.1 NUDIX domain protein [Bacteriovorax sp. Seq25_V]
MKESVSAIFIHKDKVFLIKRQNYLKAFPGYYSFPGGKVDEIDTSGEDRFVNALARELEEELGVDIKSLLASKKIDSISEFGVAVTPDFNPHRFKNYYFKIFLNEEIKFDVDEGEIAEAEWLNAKEAFDLYDSGKMLVVPPMIKILKDLSRDILSTEQIDPNLKYDGQTQVPMIIPVSGLNQYLPLSNTFPPANRTNSFFIGDGLKVLIDPSPKNEEEYKKFLQTLVDNGHVPELIFLTHHHPDHHEYAIEMCEHFGVGLGLSEDSYERLSKKLGKDYFRNIKIRFYKEGEILTQSKGHDVQVLSTPGHDEGQLSLLRADNAWMIVSDLIQSVGTVVIGGEEGDMKKYFTSLKRVIDINPLSIFPSHGIGLGGIDKIAATLKHRLEREESISKYLDEGKSEDEMLSLIYPDLPERLHLYARVTIEAHISKIKRYGTGI